MKSIWVFPVLCALLAYGVIYKANAVDLNPEVQHDSSGSKGFENSRQNKQLPFCNLFFMTPMECGGIKSFFTSERDPNTVSGIKQWWRINGKDNYMDFAFTIRKWACLPSNAGERIIFWMDNTGNCNDCERLEIWTPEGNKISSWKNFNRFYKSQGFPLKQGENFSRQFQPISLPLMPLKSRAD
ncbi:MAG: hypothetical protein JWM96_545 [Alphaproteobacteria bacterium]|nr:hypothetical protein [Alphaproteobacteria bacterium]